MLVTPSRGTLLKKGRKVVVNRCGGADSWRSAALPEACPVTRAETAHTVERHFGVKNQRVKSNCSIKVKLFFFSTCTAMLLHRYHA